MTQYQDEFQQQGLQFKCLQEINKGKIGEKRNLNVLNNAINVFFANQISMTKYMNMNKHFCITQNNKFQTIVSQNYRLIKFNDKLELQIIIRKTLIIKLQVFRFIRNVVKDQLSRFYDILEYKIQQKVRIIMNYQKKIEQFAQFSRLRPRIISLKSHDVIYIILTSNNNYIMGQCVCSETVPVISEISPLVYTQRAEVIKEPLAISDEPLIQDDIDKIQSQTKTRQTECSLVFEFNKPNCKVAMLTNELFLSSSQKVKELLDKLGPYEDEEVETSNHCVYELKNGSLYKGGWLEDQKSGKGNEIQKNGSLFEGQFYQGLANGRGRMIYCDGDYYIGDWVDDQHHGYGEYYHYDGSLYKGQWFQNLQHGQGFELFSDQSTYKGDFQFGKRSGEGIYKFNDGCMYEGEFRNNQFNGYGTFNWTDGRVYAGEWRNDKKDGKGKMIWADGTIYEGEYKNDKKHGFGTLRWPDNRQYSGQWEDGKQNGVGEYRNAQQGSRKGHWINGKRVLWFD
ncbi:unnamed protein product [Paramecium octaurelia]|uniref:MORN repeat protein n=1 Tax=Paramecium octaurelia TaxID=43137 RepID=A0A8S1TM67_PAROT|nr:unnamed protein product [Paramecium octaurelia]